MRIVAESVRRFTLVNWRDRLRAMRMDTTPLQSRDFRLLFFAGTVFYFGAMVSYVAIPYQIYTLTGSNFAVGAIGLVELVPLIIFGLYGGALADHVDRRKLLILTGIAQALFTAVLCVNAFLDDPNVPLIFVVSGFLAASSSMQRPSREALMPQDGQARPDRRRQLADQPRHADRCPRRTGRRRPDDRVHRDRLVLRGRHLRARGRHAALRRDAAVPPPRRDHPAEPGRDRRGHEVRAQAPRPARHLPRRHRRDVPGHAGRAVPGAGRSGLRPARDPRPALLRRDRRRADRHRPQRLDRPDPPPRPRDRDRRRGVRRVRRAGRPDAERLADAVLLHAQRLRPT